MVLLRQFSFTRYGPKINLDHPHQEKVVEVA